jgi:ferrous iron transport protein B
LIGAFIPERRVLGVFSLQGLVMFALYFGAIIFALMTAFVIRKGVMTGPRSPLLMELPTYKLPSFRGVCLGLLERAKIFLHRAGTVILSLSVILWFLASYPKPHTTEVVDSAHPAILYSYAGKIGKTIEPLLRPLGFDWRVSVALIPGFAAREVMVGALATVYSIEKTEKESTSLSQQLARDWSLPVALSLLVWYVFACQCLSTLAVTRRETNSWRWPAVMLGYMTVLAYLASFLTYQITMALGVF